MPSPTELHVPELVAVRVIRALDNAIGGLTETPHVGIADDLYGPFCELIALYRDQFRKGIAGVAATGDDLST